MGVKIGMIWEKAICARCFEEHRVIARDYRQVTTDATWVVCSDCLVAEAREDRDPTQVMAWR